jgi:hypothetical protein
MSDTAWSQLVNAALVGTDRTAYSPVQSTGQLGDLLAKLDGTTGELALRQAAAILASYRQAGRGAMVVGLADVDPALAADLDVNIGADLPHCSRAATSYLQQMLAGEMGNFLPDYLAVLAQQGQRVPDRLLPRLLDRGRDKAELREAIGPVLGARGRWLAARRSDWSYAIVAVDLDPEDTVWETGEKAARRQYLEALRRQDPDRARERLAETFSQDSAADRAVFVAMLATHLSVADLPFLESLLTDRSKVVQQAAIQLLARLPASSICRGAIEQLRRLLRIQKSGDQITAIEVNQMTFDKGFKRIELDPHQAKQHGDFGATLIGVISAIPLATWQEEFGVDPSRLMDWTKRSDWKNEIAIGLVMAVIREENPTIATIIIRLNIKNRDRTVDLFKLLNDVEKDRFLRWACDIDKSLFWHVVTHCVYRWGSDIAEFIVVQIVRELRSSNCNWSMVYWLPDRMIDCVPDGAIDSILAFESPEMLASFANNGYIRQGVEKLCQALRFRRAAMAALQV